MDQKNMFRGHPLKSVLNDHAALVALEHDDEKICYAQELAQQYRSLFESSEEHPQEPFVPIIVNALRSEVCLILGMPQPGDDDVDFLDWRFSHEGTPQLLGEEERSPWAASLGLDSWEQSRREYEGSDGDEGNMDDEDSSTIGA